MKKIILKNFIGALVFFGIGFFLVKARNGLQVSPGDTLQASKRNQLANQVSTIGGQISSLSGQVSTLSSSSLKLANGSNTKICSGKSSPSSWILFGNNCTIYTTIDISSCGFSSSPQIFTSMGGQANHRTTVGTNSIYSLTKNSFVIYVSRLPYFLYNTSGIGCAASSSLLLSTSFTDGQRFINRIAIGN